MNSWEIGASQWRYNTYGRDHNSEQGGCQIDQGRLNAGMAVRTRGGFLLGLVVMEQSSEECKNEDRNNGKGLDWKALPDAPFWIPWAHSGNMLVYLQRRLLRRTISRAG